MGRGGVEPPTHGFSVRCDNGITSAQDSTSESSQKNLSLYLALLVQKHPDLALIAEAWPNLPEHIRAAIKALVQTHTGEDQK